MSDSDEQPKFNAFNPHGPVHVYHRNLPHWRQDGSTYFATFRLGDSIPKFILLKWQEEDFLWLKAKGVEVNGAEHRSAELPEELREEFARRSARRMHVELDECHGSCLFRKPEIRKVLAEALEHFHGERWWIGDYVIMPNHVHLLVQPICGKNGAELRSTALENILGAVKGFVSTHLSKQGIKEGKLWQQENYDRLVRDRVELDVWRKYIRENPSKANLHFGEFTHWECDWL
jgi:type I restriction enzyme R subunit